MYYKFMCMRLRASLPRRKNDCHKGDVGKVLLLCGSEGYTGAAALASMGALRSGVGLVYLGVPRAIYQIEAVKLNEPVVFPLSDKNGKMAEDAIEQIDKILTKVDAVLIGPGIGISEETEKVVCYVLEHFEGPVVLDADGITVMQMHKDILRDRAGQTVITPHEGEFSRFTGEGIVDRRKSAVDLAKQLNITVVLKGHRTVVTNGDDVYVNMTGNPGMAVGGCGDVLAGIIVSLIGQGMPLFKAAAYGVWLHGAAGDLCARKLGKYGMLPTDMINVLPRLMK